MKGALSMSFIVSSGAVKDAGLWLIDAHGVPEFWMPFATGLLFLPAFMLFAWLLSCMPPPAKEDEAERSHRSTMNREQRWGFTLAYFPGMALLLVLMHSFLTAFRDYRDNFGVEIVKSLGIDPKDMLFTRTELVVGFCVALVMIGLERKCARMARGWCRCSR